MIPILKFISALQWKAQIDASVCLPDNSNIPMVLVANKFDLVEDFDNTDKLDKHMSMDYLNDFAKENGFVGAFRTSAKTGLNVTTMFSYLVRDILKHDLKVYDELLFKNKGDRGQSIKLNKNSFLKGKEEKKKGCC
jgi:GTPase SAR1 family protein